MAEASGAIEFMYFDSETLRLHKFSHAKVQRNIEKATKYRGYFTKSMCFIAIWYLEAL